MTGDLAALRELARTFLAREVVPHRQRWAAQREVDRELWTKAGSVGLLCLSIPQEYGGGGGTFAHEVVLLEEQARAGDASWGHSVHSGIVARYLLDYATEQQKRHWLPRLARGELVGAIAITEPDAGSDLQGIRTRAVRDGDEYVLNGSKTFITNGAQADLVVVAAKVVGAPSGYDVSLLVVDADRAGFRRGRVLDKAGMHGQDTAELFFDDVRVPADRLLGGAEGLGSLQLMEQLARERLIIAVTSVATMETVVADTVAYTKQRTAFGGTVFDLQNTRFRLAECASEAVVCRVFVDHCVRLYLKDELDFATAAMAKWWCSDRAYRVVDDCVQLHGGYGYLTEYPVARAWADIRVQRIYGGTNEIMKEMISRLL